MKKILLIEDDEAIAMLEKDYLEAHNYLVTIKYNGLEGLASAKKEEYDLIVLDIMLPDMDGFSILKVLREKINIPVLLVSAKSMEIDKIKGFGLGADDYITKPFNFNEFVARVDAHISRYERLTEKKISKKLKFGELTIEPEERRVFLNETEVYLTNKEFEILLYLSQTPNQVFTKEKLMDIIWGYDSNSDTSTITVHIKRIREKIESEPHKPKYIETVWGYGYRFKV